MTTIADAAAFLTREYGISGMKLQKILYYAQAQALANEGEALFADDFEAWRLGPVNREVWEAGETLGTPMPLPDSAETLLRVTWAKYGHLDAHELSELTHSDAPWKEARAGLPAEASCNRTISKKAMENFYLCRQLVQQQDGTWRHLAPTEAEWREAKLRRVLERRQHGQLMGEAQERFIRAQVIATQRLEGITVSL